MKIAVAGLIAAAGLAPLAGAQARQFEVLVSAPEDPYLFGVQGSRNSAVCDLSGNGRHVVFESDAQQLIEADRNGRIDVFLRDRVDGTIARVNHYAGGGENPGGATSASISNGGRYVALLSGDSLHDPQLEPLLAKQVYRIDRDTGAVQLATRTSSGAPSASDSSRPAISGNGRFVAFASWGTQFGVPTNGLRQIYRWDAQTDTVALVSADAAGAAASMNTDRPAISNNGRFVAFTSGAGNLVPNDTNGLVDVFVKDMNTGAIVRASVDSGGNQTTTGHSSAPAIAGDGSAVVFQSSDAGLVAGDGNGVDDVFVHFFASGQTLRVSVDGSGTQLAAGGFGGSIDGDAQAVVFHSRDEALVGAEGDAQVFRMDLGSGAVQALSQAQGADATRARISGNGDSTCFDSTAGNLVAGDVNGYADVFVSDMASLPGVELASVAVEALPLTSGNESSYHADVDATGYLVAFASNAALDSETFAQAGGHTRTQIHVRDMLTGVIDRVSSSADGGPAGGDSSYPRISANGRVVAYESEAEDIDGDDDNHVPDVFRHDLVSGQTLRISLNDGYEGIGAWRPSISDDGARIAFLSDGDGFVPGDDNESTDVFVWDAATGLSRVNLGPLDVEADGGDAYSAEISGDGRHVAFDTYASNLVDGDTNNALDVFVRDLDAGTTERVSVSAAGKEGDASSGTPSISRDGRYVAFLSGANNLVPGDTVRANDIFLVDRQNRTIERITDEMDGGAASDIDVAMPRLTPDGSRVVFLAWRPPSGPFGVMVHDIASDEITARLPATMDAYLSETLATNANGSVIALDWLAPLAIKDVNQLPDIYLLVDEDAEEPIFRDGFDVVAP